MNITPQFLNHRQVLFVVDPSLGIEAHPFVNVGRVESIDTAERIAQVSFMYHGYKSTVERVPFSHILAVYDLDHPTVVRMYNYSGQGHDLRGVEPFGSHKLAEK